VSVLASSSPEAFDLFRLEENRNSRNVAPHPFLPSPGSPGLELCFLLLALGPLGLPVLLESHFSTHLSLSKKLGMMRGGEPEVTGDRG
jgi:hypothetical protein